MEKGLLRIQEWKPLQKGSCPTSFNQAPKHTERKHSEWITLADRLNHIIKEQGISKADFARLLGISENYVYILTGNSRSNSRLSPPLAKLIALELGYDVDWSMNGKE